MDTQEVAYTILGLHLKGWGVRIPRSEDDGIVQLAPSESRKQMAYDVSMMRFLPLVERKKKKSD